MSWLYSFQCGNILHTDWQQSKFICWAPNVFYPLCQRSFVHTLWDLPVKLHGRRLSFAGNIWHLSNFTISYLLISCNWRNYSRLLTFKVFPSSEWRNMWVEASLSTGHLTFFQELVPRLTTNKPCKLCIVDTLRWESTGNLTFPMP